MGLFDSVWVKCPTCNTNLEFQSKTGKRELKHYTLNDTPNDVLTGINRHSPIRCSGCKRFYEIHFNPLSIAEVKL